MPCGIHSLVATLGEVARSAGVSVATASRVVNGANREVAPALQKRVLAAAQALRYVPNAQAQALVRAHTSTVGVIVHDVSEPYFSEVTRGILKLAASRGLLATICNTYHDPEADLVYVRLLRSQRVRVMLLTGSGWDDRKLARKLAAEIEAFEETGGRAALVGRHLIPADAVMPDNVGGARALGEALANLGHRRFGVLAGPSSSTTSQDRLAGLRSALRERRIKLTDDQVIASDFTREGGARATVQLLHRFPTMTMLCAFSDSMAVGALAVLRDRGLRVPEDISVTGFDDIPMLRDVQPALSTVRVHMEALGMRAFELASESGSAELRLEVLPTDLVMRESTARPREDRV